MSTRGCGAVRTTKQHIPNLSSDAFSDPDFLFVEAVPFLIFSCRVTAAEVRGHGT